MTSQFIQANLVQPPPPKKKKNLALTPMIACPRMSIAKQKFTAGNAPFVGYKSTPSDLTWHIKPCLVNMNNVSQGHCSAHQ